MSAGLFGLLDDVAAIAKLAAASVDDVGAAAGRATAKAAGVVVDDTAVTPQYVHGVTAARELPMIKKIAWGSIRNKLLIILPAALILNALLPDLLPIILMAGGTFLAYEGAHKVWHKISGHHDHETPVTLVGPEAEKSMVSGAIRTDLILSAEIMVIALNEVAEESFLLQFSTLVVVAFVITIAVYGVVALIVKMDDTGLLLTQRSSAFSQRLGHGMVNAMPKVLAVISVVGTIAMLWVGGHILLANLAEAGWWHAPYDAVHDVEHEVEHAVHGFLGSTLAWLANTAISAVVGLVVGLVVVGIVAIWPVGKKAAHADDADQAEQAGHADHVGQADHAGQGDHAAAPGDDHPAGGEPAPDGH
jgi:predicted DNA repair protein MutK